ncbi:DNA gyrase inhibitor [Pseudonocardia sulfidoxydans NBRC 16205]|uniref:DNA gyrase inhibitor n=2 Tax=Pseudonocardia sulfidoxydans TaxID=54011 RepID=A0A511DBA5_9PSEU|nr:GyrI-like domain-containing protein [Pseudonocardia sulfidoxydans]GEL22079.1 DNA gyrase inhibitor [Pseudonocardia sulfidoxydans NBRC 16205]
MGITYIAAPHVTQRPAQPYIFTTREVTTTTIGEIADRIPELLGWLAGRGITPAGAPFLRYLTVDTDGKLLVEAGVPVAEPVEGDENVDVGVLPAGRYAGLTHRGHPDELVQATTELQAWADEQGLTVDRTHDGRWSCRLELFHTHPAEVPIDAWVTELAFELAD